MSVATTLVRDSIVGDEWIRRTAEAVPIQRVLDDHGNPTGDILTGPVRLAFTDNLFDGQENDSGVTKHDCVVMFTPLADFTVMTEEYYKSLSIEFPNKWDANSQQYFGVVSPFKAQDEKLNYNGFTPGCTYMTVSSQYRPAIVDIRHNPIADKTKVYPGVWAIVGVKPYAFGKAGKTKDGKPMKQGIGFGLQSIMIIGDDTKFGGGAPDTKQVYKNVGANVTAPIARPDHVAAGMQSQAPASSAPHIPQQHYQPQAAAAGAPSATPPYSTPPSGTTAPASYATTTSPSNYDPSSDPDFM